VNECFTWGQFGFYGLACGVGLLALVGLITVGYVVKILAVEFRRTSSDER